MPMRKITMKITAAVLAAAMTLSALPAFVYAEEETIQETVTDDTGEEIPVSVTAPSFTATDMAGDELSFDLRLSGFDKTGRLRVAVWSADQGQDDLVWYDLAVDGDDYHVAVKPSAHGSAGPYYAHLYYWEGYTGICCRDGI